MVNVLVFGAGSVGAVYIYNFLKAGAKVTAVCRTNYDAVKKGGFLMNSKKFGDNVRFKPDVVRTPEEASQEKWDYIFVCSKCFPESKPSLSDLIRPCVGPKTSIVLVQNGIQIEEEPAASFPDNPILSTVVYLPATQTSPGVIENQEPLNMLEIGTFPASAPAWHKQVADELAALLEKGGAGAKVYDDIQPQRWSKLIVNASWNPIAALSRCSDRDFLRSSPNAVDLVWGVMLEVVSIAKAMGIEGIDEGLAESQLARAKTREVGVEPSMLADVRENRAFEIEAIVGNAVRLAKEHGVKVPLLDAIYALGKGLYDAGVRSRPVTR